MSDNMESDLVPQSSKNEDSDDGKSDKTIIDRTESSSLDMTNERKSIYKIFTNAASAFVAADLSLFSKEKKDKDPNLIKINLAVSVDNVKFIKFVINENSTADDICLLLCQKLGIGPVARQLFALRIHGTNLYLSPSIEIKLQNKENVYDFRIRFQMADVGKLQRLDNKATEYLFHQVRVDLIKGHIIDLDIEKYKPEIMGLVVLDMYRVILEKNISKDDIMTDYIKYVPNAIFRKHFFFTKTPISNSLNDVCRVKRSVIYTIQQYLKAFWEMKSNYPTEIYKADFINGDNSDSVTIKITPFNEEQAGIRFMFDNKQKNFQLLCSIEELCFISINEYNRVEISRKNGIPLYLKFNSKIELTSFISLLDGYYRMMVKWTFNLCKDLPTQSLLKLYKSKCHGPIGGEYSYYKLDQKRDNRSGCFILRECDKKYNEFYIDVCTKNINKPQSFKIEKLNTDEYIFNDDVTRYKSIIQLIRSYNDPKNPIYLKECLPPSEYDDSPLLLLCKEEKFEKHKFSNELIMSDLTSFRTIVINARELQVYKSKKLDCDNGVITVYRSIWRVNECKKIETTLKVLNKNFYDKNSNEFLKIASQWAFLHTNSIIRLFGITIHNPIAMVMEYMKLGPLDKYLQEKKTSMKQVELVEAASNLAAALYYLEENGIIHGKIRCRKLFVSSHNEKSFSVRLADPGIAKPFTTDDIHWIPCENYSDLDTARQSKTADTWALSTTLWEIFMYGEQPPNLQNNRMFYLNGKRLSQPTNCPSNIYQIMFDCWNKDPDKRKIPQEILRDINRILYQAYNSRESHSYAKVALKNIPENIESNLCMSSSPSTSISNITDEANLELKEYNPINLEMPECSSYFHSESRQIENVENVSTTNYNIANTDSYTVSNINVNLEKTRLSSSMTSIDSIESVFEFDEHCNVVLQGRIGQGFYGEVFKGTLEWIHEKRDSRKVAIKKLKTSCITLTSLKDFEREISIMKALKHPNIVEILGIIQEPEISLIMEYLDHGSLQCYLKIHKESLSIPQLLKFSLDVAKGMQYLGEQNVIHRDLAARNILVVNESTVKISDFGLAQVLGSSDYYILQTCRDLPIKWYALESLRDGKFSPRSDVWSYGVTLYEIFSFGEDPQLVSNNVDSDHEQVILLKALEQGRRYPCPVNCPQGIYVRIIHPCWNADAHSRPIFRQLCIEIEGLLESY